MKQGSIVGIDLAKNVFQVALMNNSGRIVWNKNVSRCKLFDYVMKHCKGVVAMEACGGSHYWAGRFESVGFDVRIMPGQFVKPYVKSNKNDEIDAEAICEAGSRPQMRFVATRSEWQQDIQNLHRIRDRLVRQRTGLSNEIRGLLLEYGIVMAKGISHVRNKVPSLIEEHGKQHSVLWRTTFTELYEEFCAIDERIKDYDKRIGAIASTDERCKRLLEIPGVGELAATAVVAAVGDARAFKNGRQFAAWLGLVPKQFSSGGKPRLGHISKRGDKYLRKLLVLGARSAAFAAERRRNHKDPHKQTVNKTAQWLFRVADRRGSNRAIVALANKTARRIWTVLAMGESFKEPEELLALAV